MVMSTVSPLSGSFQGLKLGIYLSTLSVRRTYPFSINCMKASVVPTHLLTEARSKSVSVVIGSTVGTTDLLP